MSRTPHLPIHEKRDAIAEAIRRHQVVVVSGDTGSGKTTQLPQICHQALKGTALIGCTQPRRVAAVSLAKRVAEECRTALGELVGVQVRFLDQTSPQTRIKFMTDGILLAETRGDRKLRKYDAIIVDEAHERTLNIDFTLGYLRNLLARRPDLKIIISSATLDVERFSKFFGDAPVIEIEGQTFPVEDHYLPPENSREEIALQVARGVDWVKTIDRQGDILVFLPGEREIQDTADLLTGRQFPRTKVLALYARLSLKDQQEVFRSSPGTQRIVLATNVAETSLTIPGIVYVIDSGLARINRYDPRSHVQRLLTERISQASARQRRGRCGRVSEGVCVRLYDEDDFERRPGYTDPEIRRTSLAGVILQMKSLRLPPIEDFPFIDPPQRRLVSEGYKQLQELGALDENKRLTEIGREMARLPIDPCLAKILIHARDHHQVILPWMLVIVAALATQDPKERPREKRDAADAAHRPWQDARSDFMARIHLWRALCQNVDDRGRPRKNLLRRFCGKHFLNYRRVMEWFGVARELAGLMRIRQLPYQSKPATEGDYLPIHECLLAGLPRGAAQRQERREFRNGSEQEFLIFPGSGLAGQKKLSEWLLGFELVETSRLYARQVAAIEPEWLEKAAPHLCRYHYSHPRWDAKQGAVYAREHVTCVGLRILDNRQVHFGRIHPPEARKTFIHEALVPGDLRTRGAFKERNAAIVAAVKLRETKLRKADSLYCHEAVFEFFDERLPAEICTGKAFEKWRQEAEARDPNILCFQEDDICYPQLTPFVESDYPDEVVYREYAYPIYYQLSPGESQDGLTLACSLAYLNDFPDWLGDWLVPGYLREKVVLLIKSLPKEARIACQPVEKTAEAFVTSTVPEGDLLEKLAFFLTREIGRLLEPGDFNLERLPPHLTPSYWIGDDDGNELASGEDLAALRQRLAPKLAQWFDRETKTWEQSGLTQFPQTELPVEVVVHQTPAYPALVDEGKTVGIRCFSENEKAQSAHRLGLARLTELRLPDQIHHLRQHFPLGPQGKSMLPFLGRGGKRNEAHLLTVTIDAALGGTEASAPKIRQAEMFHQNMASLRSELFDHADVLAKILESTITHYQGIARQVEEHRGGPYAPSIRDIESQLDDLFMPGFLLRAWAPRLKHYPRYFRALETRLTRLLSAPPNKDTQKLQRVQPFHQAYRERLADFADAPLEIPGALRAFGWQLQEFRIAVFAPEVGTQTKVSEKRLSKALEELA